MTEINLRLVFVPWGVDNAGDDLWLFENGLVFAMESLLDALPPRGSAQYADLYSQLSGEAIRTMAVKPIGEEQLGELADRAPVDTDAIIDGMLTVQRDLDSGGLTSVEIAPRLLFVRSREIAAPEAFVFDSFNKVSEGIDTLPVADPAIYYNLAFALAEAALGVVGVEIPAFLGPEFLQITESWPAHLLFLKAKRLAKTTDEKIGFYKQALRLDPHFFWARYNIAQLLKQQEDYAGARREFLASIKDAKDDPALLGDTFFELGLCSIFMSDTKTARHFWDDALRYAPDNPSLLVNVAGTYEQEEDWHRAIELHEQALTISPDYHKAIVSLARLKAMVGQLPTAITLYERALALQPNDPLREAILGGCYLADGDEDSARTHLERASQLDPPRARQRGEEDQPAPGDYARAELDKLR